MAGGLSNRELEKRLLAVTARIAQLEETLAKLSKDSDKIHKPDLKNAKRKSRVKEEPVESDSDDIVLGRPRRKIVKNDTLNDNAYELSDVKEDESDYDHKQAPARKSNVKPIRLLGAGKQNRDVESQPDRTLEELLGDLEVRKPGARKFVDQNIDAHQAALENGTWTNMQCFTLHHQCGGTLIRGQFPRHQVSPTCGFCISRKGGPCRLCEDGKDCERCQQRDMLCITYDDMSNIYKKLDDECPLNEAGLEKWPLIKEWVGGMATSHKIDYGIDVINSHINNRTYNEPHSLHDHDVAPCKLVVSGDAKKSMPRGWFALFCDEPVIHRRNVAHINLLRLRHFLDAVDKGNEDLITSIVDGRGQVSHLCKPLQGKYCWEWTHTTWESSDSNAVRDHYCFKARRLCECSPPCFYNGEGSRFVLNLNPKLEKYNGWKPARGRKSQTRYSTAELGAVDSEKDALEIVGEGTSENKGSSSSGKDVIEIE